MSDSSTINNALYEQCIKTYGPRAPFSPAAGSIMFNTNNVIHIERWLNNVHNIDIKKMKQYYKDNCKPNRYINSVATCWRDDANIFINNVKRKFGLPFSSLSETYEPDNETPRPVVNDTPVIMDEVVAETIAKLRTTYEFVTEPRLRDVIKSFDKTYADIRREMRPTQVHLTINNVPECVIPNTRHCTLPTLLKSVHANVPVALIGPAGSGKTTACEQVADALSLEFYMQGAVSGSHEFLGFKDARGEYHGTPFRQAFEHGGMFLADEIDGSDPAALLVINSAVANAFMNFPDSAKPIKRHTAFRMVAAANTYWSGGDRVYVGRSQLDGATLDRFAMIDWSYDEKLELLLTQATAKWTAYVQAVRKSVQVAGLRHIVSPRASINGAKLATVGMSYELIAEMVLFKGIPDDDKTKLKEQCARVQPW